MRIVESKEGAIIELSVKPRQLSFRISFDGDELIVSCTEEPMKGKVNKELLKQLSKSFKREVRLISGATSRQKLVLVVGATRGEVTRMLCQAQSRS